MGQKQSRERLRAIQTNVLEISRIVHFNNMNPSNLTPEDRTKYEEILLSYSQELKFILSKSVKPTKLNPVHKLIQLALQELNNINIRSTLRRIDSDINYLTRLHGKNKSLQDLDEINKSLWALNKDLSLDNFKDEKEIFNNLKHKVDSIEEVSEEVSARKYELFAVVSSVENVFLELEMEDRVKQVEEKHSKNKVDLRRFVGVSDSKCYKSHRKFLVELREEVNRILEVSVKIVELKKYVLFNIDNNIVAMDQKVKENEEKIRKQIETEIVAPLTTNERLIFNLVESYKNFEKSFSAKCDLSELREIFNDLSDIKVKIDQKLKIFELQIGNLPENRLEIIQKELEGLRKKVETTTFFPESEEYRRIRNALEEYREEVRSFENGKFQDNILKYIDGVVDLLENKILKRNSTSGDILIDIISLSASVNELGEQIRKNSFDNADIDSLESTLEDHLDYLKNLKLSPGRNNICKLRDYVEIQIESHLSNLRKIKICGRGKDMQFLV